MRKFEDVEIKSATREDLERFYNKPWNKTVRAWIVSWKGKEVLVAGYIMHNGRPLAFSDMRENDAPLLVKFRVAKELLRIMQRFTVNIYSPQGNMRFLRLLGFEPTDMKIDETPLYRWRPTCRISE